ncbi:putative integral membrane protein [Rubidibacter lacunae KORDI 51-2]|uniref:Putative integral membrane protein n=1 Tax=Rubidibacter lacunae KORDI 51-2 TaxID=582515 RepID=U5DN89_9CHRO|nr:lysylphosphatidylglycerol synthase domain-containing protein [Rubidibacter lacunae]ERN42332.1 putative integral membrane protein [Rubidibacter lacunae KORDI 51-2]
MKFLRWFVLGATLFFLARAVQVHWQEVAGIELNARLFGWSAIAFLITLLAHVWSGVVWLWILRFCRQPAEIGWVLRVYLQTNIAKYVPGNVWHFYGRIWAVKSAGAPMDVALLCVLLEPLLMAAAAVAIAIAAAAGGWLTPSASWQAGYAVLPLLGLAIALAGVHPRVLNPALGLVARIKGQKGEAIVRVERYPWLPLVGEVGFVLLRGLGFVAAMAGFVSVGWGTLPLLLGTFGCAWFLGLVIPTPGGLGVFEATAIALLDGHFPAGAVLAGVAVFRLLGIAAEAIAAGAAYLAERWAS